MAGVTITSNPILELYKNPVPYITFYDIHPNGKQIAFIMRHGIDQVLNDLIIYDFDKKSIVDAILIRFINTQLGKLKYTPDGENLIIITNGSYYDNSDNSFYIYKYNSLNLHEPNLIITIENFFNIFGRVLNGSYLFMTYDLNENCVIILCFTNSRLIQFYSLENGRLMCEYQNSSMGNYLFFEDKNEMIFNSVRCNKIKIIFEHGENDDEKIEHAEHNIQNSIMHSENNQIIIQEIFKPKWNGVSNYGSQAVYNKDGNYFYTERDNIISRWDSNSGKLKFKVKLPETISRKVVPSNTPNKSLIGFIFNNLIIKDINNKITIYELDSNGDIISLEDNLEISMSNELSIFQDKLLINNDNLFCLASLKVNDSFKDFYLYSWLFENLLE